MKNYIDIITNEDKTRAINVINTLSTNKSYRLFIDDVEKIKTIQQLKFFHKILDCFTNFMQNQEYSFNNSNDWKAIIKKRIHFFKSNTGISFLPNNLKLKLFQTIENGDFTKDEKIQIYYCFREQSLKSLSEANTTEANLLIDESILLCVETMKNLIDFRIITKETLQQELKNNYVDLYDIIIKWKDGFLNTNNKLDVKQQEIYNLIIFLFQ